MMEDDFDIKQDSPIGTKSSTGKNGKYFTTELVGLRNSKICDIIATDKLPREDSR
jgi:hypothetical protein